MKSSNNESKKIVIINYIKKNPTCSCRDIRKGTKLHIERYYKSIVDAYKDAGLNFPRLKRNKEQQINDIINYIKNYPGCTVTEIQNSTHTTIPHLFKSITEAYQLANIPYQRKNNAGATNPIIRKRCINYEKEVIRLLGKFGSVKSHIKTKVGIIDCIFDNNNCSFIVEIKDLRGRNNITKSHLNQLIRYMDALNYNNGLIVCPKDKFPKKINGRNIYIESKKIQIISDDDLRGRSIK